MSLKYLVDDFGGGMLDEDAVHIGAVAPLRVHLLPHTATFRVSLEIAGR